MKKHLYYIYLLSVSFFIYGCSREKDFTYSEIQQEHISAFDIGFSNYCQIDLKYNYEDNAVFLSFYGDYQRALDQREIMQEVSNEPYEEIDFGVYDKELAIRQLELISLDNEASDNDKALAINMLSFINSPPAIELFGIAKPVNAIKYITEQAKRFHFTLINEAHYNSQHRSFTADLLEPLWELGYRYLALETLNHTEHSLADRGYPVRGTGFYTQDSNFGNMIREAIRLGYTFVPYETQYGHHGNMRERDQANNIYDKTWQCDQIGKVLVHAGYSHILEYGDEEKENMGFLLKNLVGQDILTIDQVTMTAYPDMNKQHQYYQAAAKSAKLSEPTIFLNNGKVIVDPLNNIGIDLQVYHPKTKFVRGRPDWMSKKDTRTIPLLTDLLEYKGHLIQAVRSGEALDAVPVDQFVIDAEKVFILNPGNYDLRVINCEGDLIASLSLNVK